MAVCPGQLYSLATDNRATCSRAPQRCVSQTTPSPQQIVCECAAVDGGPATWSCR